MPTYEYACRACEHRFDIVQKMSDDPLVICPECGGELRKVFTAPSISFKGSGFYATDHGKKSKSAGAQGSGGDKKSEEKTGERSGEKKDAGSGSGGEKKSEKKSESKSEGSGAKKDGGSS